MVLGMIFLELQKLYLFVIHFIRIFYHSENNFFCHLLYVLNLTNYFFIIIIMYKIWNLSIVDSFLFFYHLFIQNSFMIKLNWQKNIRNLIVFIFLVVVHLFFLPQQLIIKIIFKENFKLFFFQVIIVLSYFYPAKYFFMSYFSSKFYLK